MIKNRLNVEAVEIAYTFGLEEKFPIWKILTSFLRECKEEWKRTREEDSPQRLVCTRFWFVMLNYITIFFC